MRSKKRTVGILIVVIVVLLGFAGSLLVYRNKLSSEKTKNNLNNNTAQSLSFAPSGRSIENFYDKPITDEKIALDSIEMNRDKLGYSDKNFTFRYDKKSGSETAYHFDLYYKDIPVYEKGVGVFTHYSDNSAKVLMSSVSDAEKIIKVNTIPKITEDEAFNIAKETLGENFSEYNIGADFKQVKNKPKLTIYKYNDEYNLAYYIQSVSYMCVINAENGDIIEYHSTAMSNSAQYEGQKGDIHEVFYDDYKDEKYDIKNALWNKDKDLFIFDNCIDGISLNYILKLDDIKNGNNKSAVDGMANTYRAMGYFEQEYFNVSFNNTWVIVNNDKSKDGNGKTRKDNATGQVYFISDKPVAIITFDLRSKKNNAQLSAYLDIVGHEYTHTITGLKCFGSSGYNTDSKYFEQNALMEAYSDIFGQLIEQKYTGKTDWIQSVPDNSRNLKKTKTYSKRRKTKDDKGTEKNYYGYAHDNSTIISHTAYLMSKSNDSKKYDAEFLLDYNQLGQLWYGSLEYLKKTEFKDFADCRYAVEESARGLIEKGILVEDNLKVIEQAFNDVEVSSNPARRGAMDSAEIKEKHTLVVPIEDETQSTEPVEIKELNYTWHLDPTIEAEDIIVIDNKENFLENGYIYPYDECALIKQNGKYGIIKYDGTKIAEPVYELGNYDIQSTVFVYNEYDQTKGAECVDVFPDKGDLRIQINQERGWGYVGSEYLWINNKVANTMDGYSIFSGKYYDDDYNVVVQSAQLDSGKRFVNISNKYGIANKNSLLVPIEYDKGYMHSYNNIIALCKGEKWTYFNENGKSIIENCNGFESNSNVIDLWQGGDYKFYENYILPYLPTENYIPVKINGKCGYYDTQGNEVIPCGTFEEVRPVHNGLAWVKKDGKWGVIKLKDIEIEQNKENNTSKNEQQQIKELLFTGTVNTEKDPLNVRKSSSANAEIIGQIEKGSTVTVYSESGDWYEIEYNGGVGYVSKKYIKSKGNNSDTQTSNISDNEILKAVNKYLEENQSNLGVWLSDSEPYCPAEHMHSSSTNWSCPINLNWESYSANEMAGAYPHFAYVDKETLKCTLTANYETVVEFDLKDYTITGNSPWTSEQIINSINAYLKENWCGENQYYCFEEDLIEHRGYLWVCIRWDGSNSANVITGSDCKINKETGEVEISFNGEPYEWFNLKDYK